MPQLQRQFWLATPRPKVFEFFANPRNLQILTPEWLRFRIVEPLTNDLRVGTRFHYRLQLHGFPVGWESEITVWEPPERFVDEQRRGPYRFWRHEHSFVEQNGGTLVVDNLEYRVPGGALIDRWFVSKDLQKVFDFRERKLREMFGPA